MRPKALDYIASECPKALEYLEYSRKVFERLPDSFEVEGENVPVSCHHLCAIVKAKFDELIEYHGFFNADGFIKVRDGSAMLAGEHDNQDWQVDHSWLGTPDQKITLDVYPVGYSEWPMLIHGFVRQPLKYGTHFEFLFLREEKFKKEVAKLVKMLAEDDSRISS